MPKIKIKTHSGAKKRFSLTKTGKVKRAMTKKRHLLNGHGKTCLLYTSPSPRDSTSSRMPSSA